MIFPNLVTSNKAAFYAKLNQIAASLKTDPDFIECVMYLESRLDPTAYNANGGATGLIQFMPATAISLGTTTAALIRMTNLQQLDYVLRYFAPFIGKLNSFADVYGVTFFPIMLSKPDSWILHSDTLSPEKIAAANKIFDLNYNQQITAGEFRTAIYKLLPASVATYLRSKIGAAAGRSIG
jgi:hypothetical protein